MANRERLYQILRMTNADFIYSSEAFRRVSHVDFIPLVSSCECGD